MSEDNKKQDSRLHELVAERKALNKEKKPIGEKIGEIKDSLEELYERQEAIEKEIYKAEKEQGLYALRREIDLIQKKKDAIDLELGQYDYPSLASVDLDYIYAWACQKKEMKRERLASFKLS